MLRSVRERYWEYSKGLRNWQNILRTGHSPFRDVVFADHVRSINALMPVKGETARRAAAAVKWLFAAQDATPDDGMSYGYFPLSNAKGWDASYPETTGYIMTSLAQYARRTGCLEAIERSHRMALWETSIMMPSGAVQGGKITTPDRQSPAAFNTGMVLDGLVSVLGDWEDPLVLRAAERAAEFLVNDINDQGLFRTNGEFVTRSETKLYNVLCAWALYRFGQLARSNRYCNFAVRAVEGALRFQNDNGWFRECCLSDAMRPLSHTIGYTVQGVLEVGIAAGREDFVAASEKCFRAIIRSIRPNGFLAGRFNHEWRPVVPWSCLTGSAQIAIVGGVLSELRQEPAYRLASDKLVNFLKAVQRLNTDDNGIDGAIAGSFPILGDYMTGGYPNWATKYMLDALMLQAKQSGESLALPVGE